MKVLGLIYSFTETLVMSQKNVKMITSEKKVIQYDYLGKQCFRSWPSQMTNPRTARQQSNRARFERTVKLAGNSLKLLIHPYWNPVMKYHKYSGYIQFIRENLWAMDSGIPFYQHLKLVPKNKLKFTNVQAFKKADFIEFTWDFNTSSSKRGKDLLFIISLDENFYIELVESQVRREEGFFRLPHNPAVNKEYYVFWQNNNRWSESAYLVIRDS